MILHVITKNSKFFDLIKSVSLSYAFRNNVYNG